MLHLSWCLIMLNILLQLVSTHCFSLFCWFLLVTGWQPPEGEDPADPGGGAEPWGGHQSLRPRLQGQGRLVVRPLLPGHRPVQTGPGNPRPQLGRETPSVPTAPDGPSDGPQKWCKKWCILGYLQAFTWNLCRGVTYGIYVGVWTIHFSWLWVVCGCSTVADKDCCILNAI